ncbi:YceI family protein [Aestuariibaculum sediminum]|uniref:YceI family protein n=1 Tax=Aestuariibaculum sediminum TaxID=2770637 RepID=A0A8J6U9L6_9FLAO|nr:YceI family protein [Aestuariibaculum sediminum]MBD0833327.1 YceI family protein [Aestuariibaculum sediminum]
MKKVVFLVFMLATLAFTNKDTAIKNEAVVVSSKSSLVVKGTTNVHAFKCVFDSKRIENPVSVTYFSQGDRLKFKETALILNSGCFDCGGKGINKDFKSILKAETYPEIKLILKETFGLNQKKNLQTLVDVEIAGITNEYKIPVKVNDSDKLQVIGTLTLCLSDFNLEQPKKMFGLITVDDQITIDFDLIID